MKRKLIISWRAALVVLLTATAFISSAASAQRAIPVKRLLGVDTSINVSCGYWIWMSTNTMLATKCPTTKGEQPSVVAIDTKSGSERTISHNSEITAVDERAAIARISKRGTPLPPYIVGDFQVDAKSGDLVRLAELSPLPKNFGEIAAASPKGPGSKSLGSIYDGYFVPVPSALAPTSSTYPAFNDRTTRWVAQDRADIEVDVPYEEISAPVYIKYLDKYLLNGSDPGANSATNSALNAQWNRPYSLAPLRLMDPAGKVTNIDYPKVLANYGIKRDVANLGEGASFGLWMPSLPGLIVEVPRESNSAIYLLQSSLLYQIAGTLQDRAYGEQMIPADGVQQIKPSPNGCAIAFDHQKVSETDRYSGSARYLAIIQLCSNHRQK